MMPVSGNELPWDPLEQAKMAFVSVYTLNSLFWVCLAARGVNHKEHLVKQDLEGIRVHVSNKDIADKGKATELDRGAVSRCVKKVLWEPKRKNAPQVTPKGESQDPLGWMLTYSESTSALSVSPSRRPCGNSRTFSLEDKLQEG